MKNPPLQQGHDGPRAPPLRPYLADTLQRMKSYEGNAALWWASSMMMVSIL